jgi:hypothetical protein
MSEEKQSNEATPSQTTAGTNGSAGERLDHLISGAKRLSDAASSKAKEFTDAAAPRMKQFGDTASEKISRVANRQRSEGSILQKGMAFYKGGSRKRKQIIFGVSAAAVVISVLILGVLLKSAGNSSGSGPSEATLEAAPVGTKVNRLSTLTEAAVKQADGSIRKLVGVSDDWNPSTWECVRLPEVDHPVWKHSGPGMFAYRCRVENPQRAGEMVDGYCLVNDITMLVVPLPLTHADELNGIDWRGRIEYRCSLYRFCANGNWGGWQSNDNSSDSFLISGERVMYGNQLAGDWPKNWNHDFNPTPVALSDLPPGGLPQ